MSQGCLCPSWRPWRGWQSQRVPDALCQAPVCSQPLNLPPPCAPLLTPISQMRSGGPDRVTSWGPNKLGNEEPVFKLRPPASEWGPRGRNGLCGRRAQPPPERSLSGGCQHIPTARAAHAAGAPAPLGPGHFPSSPPHLPCQHPPQVSRHPQPVAQAHHGGPSRGRRVRGTGGRPAATPRRADRGDGLTVGARAARLSLPWKGQTGARCLYPVSSLKPSGSSSEAAP